jgi:hypothetical protein
MRTALLTVTALVALSSPATAQNQASATMAPKTDDVVDPTMPKVRANAPGGGVSPAGTCITAPPPYRPRP